MLDNIKLRHKEGSNEDKKASLRKHFSDKKPKYKQEPVSLNVLPKTIKCSKLDVNNDAVKNNNDAVNNDAIWKKNPNKNARD